MVHGTTVNKSFLALNFLTARIAIHDSQASGVIICCSPVFPFACFKKQRSLRISMLPLLL